MTTVFNLEGQKADPHKIGYINKVFPINKQSKYNDTIQLNIGDTTIPAKLPAKGQGWKLGKLITFQIPNNIYLHQDNDIYFFVDFTSETELKVNSMPNENQLKELEEFKIPTIEELNIKDLIINYNKNRCDKDKCTETPLDESVKKTEAAQKIQALHRGEKVRKEEKKKKAAATKIQAVRRGRMARRRRGRTSSSALNSMGAAMGHGGIGGLGAGSALKVSAVGGLANSLLSQI